MTAVGDSLLWGQKPLCPPLAFLRVIWLAVALDPEHCREIAKVCPVLRLLLLLMHMGASWRHIGNDYTALGLRSWGARCCLLDPTS